jgi:hypothetical protein
MPSQLSNPGITVTDYGDSALNSDYGDSALNSRFHGAVAFPHCLICRNIECTVTVISAYSVGLEP